MALIKCKECGREISDKATACIHCGCPVNSSHNPSEEQYKPSKKKRWLVVGLAGVAVVTVIAVVLYKAISTNGIGGLTSFLGNDKEAKVVITPELSAALQKYEQVGDFHEGLAAVMIRDENGNELIGYINEKGVEVIPCSYEQASSFSEGLAAVQGESGWQFINNKGEAVISDKCEGIGDFHNGLAPIRKNGKWGYIDKKGKEVIAPVYDNAYVFHDGYAVVVKNEKYGYIDKTGKEVISCQYDLADWFSEGLAAVVKDGKLGYVNTNGDIAIPLEYDSNVTFWPHPWYDKFKNKAMLIDEHEAFPRPYFFEHCFSDGIVSVAKNGKYGAINNKGEMVIPFEHEYIGHFADRLAAMKKNGKYGYINTLGKVVISCKYDAAGDFHDGMAYVAISQDGTEWGKFLKGYINTNGEAIIPCNLDARWAYDFHNGVAVIVLNGVPYDSEFGIEGLNDIIGLLDKSGKVTFTDEMFAKIAAVKKHQAEERRLHEERQREIERQQQEESEIKSWIEGNWRYSTQQYGMTMEMRVGISGDMIVVMMNGERHYAGPYTIEGNHIVYNRGGGSSDYIVIDKANHRLMVNDTTPMQRFNGSSSTSDGYSSSSDSRISRVEKKVQEDIEELNYMVQSGNMNPMNIQVLKQSLPSNLDQLISYYREQGNSTKYNECVYKKQVVMRIFREIGI